MLIRTGGALNSSKCSWYMIDYKCTDGEWSYVEGYSRDLMIPLPDGDTAPIPLVPSSQASKMLGIWSCPTGSDEKHITENIIRKYRIWLRRSKNGHLPAHLNWISYWISLWSSIRYGLATLVMPTTKLKDKLQKLDFDILSLLGGREQSHTSLEG